MSRTRDNAAPKDRPKRPRQTGDTAKLELVDEDAFVEALARLIVADLTRRPKIE